MRIAINGFYWDAVTTGTGQYARALVREMAEQDANHEYVVVLPQGENKEISTPPEFHERVFLYPEATPFQRVSDNFAKLYFEQVAFPRACRREHVALAHVPYFASPLNPPTRTVVTIHDLIPMILPRYRGSFAVRAYTQLVALAAHRADVIIADSECSKRDIVDRLGIAPERVHVIYLAADSRFRPIDDPIALAAIRTKYALPEKSLLYLGGFDHRKNIRVIIEAFALLPELYTAGYRLVFAGVFLGRDVNFFPDPRKIAYEVGLADDAIRIIGWVPEEDKPALYSSATLFLFPSLYEGFGLPPLEALACGVPVICSDASSLPEIVGEAAIQLDPSGELLWAEAIRSLANNPAHRAEMRARGLEQSKKFSWERAARETLAVYESRQ